MTTSPLFDKPTAHLGPVAAPSAVTADLSERIHYLENEVAELRDTIARFAELVIGEVKDMRKSQAELPVPPVFLGELPVTGAMTEPAVSETPTRRPWLLMELLHDFGTMFRMYLDPRYRVRRATQMMVPLIVGLFALNYFFFSFVFSVPILSTALEKLTDIVLAILLYKVLSREIQRYRLALSQLVAWNDYRGRTSVMVSGEPATTRLETQ